MHVKTATPDFPIQPFLADRWSPCAFQDRPVSDSDLQSLFEAARWAPSSNNEQPWNYIVAVRADPEEFQKVLACLVEANQAWARYAPVLALGVTRLRFTHNNRENRAAVHDLGLAAGNLLAEATCRGLAAHQMIGILPDKAREVFAIPPEFETWTALAIGYRGDPASLPPPLRQRDETPRTRRPLARFVFSGKWGNPAPITNPGS